MIRSFLRCVLNAVYSPFSKLLFGDKKRRLLRGASLNIQGLNGQSAFAAVKSRLRKMRKPIIIKVIQ
jgi:hypothetical protein